MKNLDKKAIRVSIPVPKVTEAELRSRREEEQTEMEKKAKEAKRRQSRTAAEEEYERIVPVSNTNRDDSIIETRSVEDAIAQMSVADNLPADRHTERRLKTSFKAFEEAELPKLKVEKPGLTHTQYKDLIWKLWKKSPDNPLNQNAESVEEDRRNADNSCISNCLSGLGHPSSASVMTDNTNPNMVYRRKKLCKGANTPLIKLEPMNVQKSLNCPSVISSTLHLASAEDQPVVFQVKDEIEMVEDPVVHSFSCNGLAKDKMQKILGIDSVNDSCSSSKSNKELVSDSMETEMNETGECSSSSALVIDVTRKELTEKDFCLNILRSCGLLGQYSLADNVPSAEDAVTSGNSFCSRSCKTCGQLDSSLNMLLCDHCEVAYHPSCYNPHLKKLPIDEWFCHSCLKRRQKILKETIIKSPGIHIGLGNCRSTSVKAEMNPILLMLKETEPYTTSVRVGKGFQAEVLDWSGPIGSDEDELPEPLEINSSEISTLQVKTLGSQEENQRSPTRLSSIGNWLQCREIIDRANTTMCGKWRRAPLFEVQTDDWECFCAIHWDPSHADCAVPQELETEHVLKQLKYIEMLKPRLAAKQRKLDCKNSGDRRSIIY